jgi:hypothetical protein
MSHKENSSARISRRKFFIASGITLAGTAYLAYQVLTGQETESNIPLFSLSINDQEITVYPLKNISNIPRFRADAAYSWNDINNQDHGLFWVVSHSNTAAGAIIDQTSDPQTRISSGGQRLDYVRTLSFNPIDPKDPNSDVISALPIAGFPAGHRFTAAEIHALVLRQSLPGAVTVALQTCTDVDGKISAGREINIYRLSPNPSN